MVQPTNLVQPSQLREVLQRHGFVLKKALGQNFLIDEHVLNKIVAAGEVTPDDGVLEIGPGAGVVTQRLAERAKKLVAVEKDTALAPVLQETIGSCLNVEVVYADILKLDLTELWKKFSDCRRVVVVANLPYYVTTPILFHILEANVLVSAIVVMVQKEVAERLAASPGTKEYGALTVAVAFRAQVEMVQQVSRGAFMPPPGVDSTVVRLLCYEHPPVDVGGDVASFRKVVRAAFATRRKTLQNALAHGLNVPKAQVQSALLAADINPQRRGETLSLPEFALLTRTLTSSLR